MNTPFLIPSALQINIDDVGWWCGSDDRKIGGPSRTGMPRLHCPEDYAAIANLGKELNMAITCAFVIGEWDMDNLLSKKIPHFSHYGDNWNNAAYRNIDAMREAVNIMNSSPYIEIALHGLYHGYYMPSNDYHDISDFYYRKDGIIHAIPESEIRNRLNHFFRLYEEHKMTSLIENFIPPSFVYRDFELSSILKEYGIKYCEPIFDSIIKTRANHPAELDRVFVENGIISVDRAFNPIEWDSVDFDFTTIDAIPTGIFGMHWPNILNVNPQKHDETLKHIVPYFKRCSETYGIVISRNMAFAATQELYRKYAEITELKNAVILDLSHIPNAAGKLDTFFISTDKAPIKFENCTLGEVQQKNSFTNYEIKPTSKIVKIHF